MVLELIPKIDCVIGPMATGELILRANPNTIKFDAAGQIANQPFDTHIHSGCCGFMRRSKV